MKKLKLAVTAICKRNCIVCSCCKGKLQGYQNIESYMKYDEIIIVGGEPLLFPDKLESFIDKLVLFNPKVKIFIQTADPTIMKAKYLDKLAGFTLLLHTMTKTETGIFSISQQKQRDRKNLKTTLKIFPDMGNIILLDPKAWDTMEFSKHIINSTRDSDTILGKLPILWL
jgi:hypothetical protein